MNFSWLPHETDSLATAALAYAKTGWSVFPCTGKHPAIAGGFKSASSDAAQVSEWWREMPEANIGWAVPVGWMAVDVDVKSGGPASLRELERKNEPLPFTLRARTGSGGEHWIFALGDAQGSRQGAGIAPGIDTRVGGRGYLLVAPSVHPETKQVYSWHSLLTPVALPAWLANLFAPKPEPPKRIWSPPKPATHEYDDRRRRARIKLEALARTVASAAKGSRNEILYWAWMRAAECRDVISQDEARSYLAPAAEQCGLSAQEATQAMR